MPLRRIDKLALIAAAIAGAALPAGSLAGDVGRTLMTFLGLIAASILPTVSLLVNSMGSNGRTVAEVQRLDAEVRAAMDALFLLFGCAAAAVGGLTILSLEAPEILRRVPYLIEFGIPARLGQAVVMMAVSMLVTRTGQIPAILRRSLTVRTEIAIDEARRKLQEKVPPGPTIRETFSTQPEFGRVVKLKDPQQGQ